MKSSWKKGLSFVLALCLLIALAAPALAVTEEEASIPLAQLAEKTNGDKAIDRPNNRYEVTVSVPGSGDLKHNEVIIMVDGSYSGDDEWAVTREAILEVGEAVLNGTGINQLTLMTFGMGDNIVLQNMKSVEELDASLTTLPGGLLYGRSSTNCEAGFTGIMRYIEEQGDALNLANIIYITDGEINTDETPRVFFDWKTMSTQFGAYVTAACALEGALYVSEEAPLLLLKAVFGEDATAESVKAAFEADELTEAQVIAFGDAVFEAVYAAAGLDPTAAYPISVVERAFVDFDNHNKCYLQDVFYMSTYKSSYVTYPNRTSRTAYAATALAAMDKVYHVYMVDTNGATPWMNPDNSTDPSKNIVGDNVSFTSNAYVTGIVEVLQEILKDISKTPYSNVFITDYMSKWVKLDQNSIRVYDKDNCIYAYNESNGAYEWLVEEAARPTAKTPIEVSLVPESEYAAGGPEVEGNKSGDIHKIVWNIKDDALLASDKYSMKYTVIVDTDEEGFRYNTSYVSNGTTTVHHDDDPDGTPIDVPEVDVPKNDPTPVPTPTPYEPFVPPVWPNPTPTPTPNPIPGEPIEDNDVPLDDGSEIIEDEDVPLVGLPNTGDRSMALSCVIIAGIAMVTFAATLLKKREN